MNVCNVCNSYRNFISYFLSRNLLYVFNYSLFYFISRIKMPLNVREMWMINHLNIEKFKIILET